MKKYEAVFGDQSLFKDSFCPDAIAVIAMRGNTNHTFHAETLGIIDDYLNGDGSCVVAMRRIIEVPEWTRADKEAGKLPPVGSVVTHIQGFCRVEVLCIYNDCVVVCNSDINGARPAVFMLENFKELFEPIETPEEKAQRLREEWTDAAFKLIRDDDYRTELGQLYDALLSGELKAPTNE